MLHTSIYFLCHTLAKEKFEMHINRPKTLETFIIASKLSYINPTVSY
jgi:hypothetical protein